MLLAIALSHVFGLIVQPPALPVGELGGMLAAGEVRVLPPGDRPDDLWPRVWALTDENGDVSDGTGVWWLASQACAAAGTAPAPPSEVADEALDEWRKWFALEA